MESFKLLYLARIHMALFCVRAPMVDSEGTYDYYRILSRTEFPYNSEEDLVLTVAGADVARQTRFGYAPIIRMGGEGPAIVFVATGTDPDQYNFEPLADDVLTGLHVWLRGTERGCDIEELRAYHGDLVDLPGAYEHLTVGEEIQLIGETTLGLQAILGRVREAGRGGVLVDVIGTTTTNISDTLWEVRRRTSGHVDDFRGFSTAVDGFYTVCGSEPIEYSEAKPFGGFILGIGMYPVPGHKWQARPLEIQVNMETNEHVARNSINAFRLDSDGNVVAAQSTSYACETVGTIAEHLSNLLSVVGDTRLGIRNPKTNTITVVDIRHGDVLLVNRELAEWVGNDQVIGHQLIDAAM